MEIRHLLISLTGFFDFSDLAVAVADQILLLESNGTFMDESPQEFSRLKALTFDNIRHQFIVSDMDDLNDTIFTVQLNEQSYIKPILHNLPDDIKVRVRF